MAGRYKMTLVALETATVKVYASPQTALALQEVTEDLGLYKSVRLAQVLDALYTQGKKDGAKAAFEATQEGFSAAQRAIPHKNPGRPRLRSSPAKSRRATKHKVV